MSQSTGKTGRRTPLSLAQKSKKHHNVTLPEQMVEAVVTVNITEKNIVEEFISSSMKQGNKDDTPINKVKQTTKPTEQKTKQDIDPSQNGNHDETKKSENGVENRDTTTSAVVEKPVSEQVATADQKIRESPRQKALREANEKKEKEEKKDNSPIVDLTIEETIEVEPVQTGETKKDSTMDASTVSTVSLLKENECKGFTDGGEEMESLIVVDESEVVDSPRPNKTPGKVLKLSTGPNRARISPFRKSDRLQNASTIVNLSTVSEQSTESSASPALTGDKNLSLRHISGRRSMSSRPLREYGFQNAYRETYRKTSDFDDSNCSINVTVGSEIHSSSFRTPIVPVIGKARKRERTPTADEDNFDDIVITEKSPTTPKRTRLDLSSFIGFMASPVTLLRNKFQNAKIQSSSTPNTSTDKIDSNDDEIVIQSTEEAEKVSEEQGVQEIAKEVVEDIEMVLLKEKPEISANAGEENKKSSIRKICNVM